jgi:hypothetical protein
MFPFWQDVSVMNPSQEKNIHVQVSNTIFFEDSLFDNSKQEFGANDAMIISSTVIRHRLKQPKGSKPCLCPRSPLHSLGTRATTGDSTFPLQTKGLERQSKMTSSQAVF